MSPAPAFLDRDDSAHGANVVKARLQVQNRLNGLAIGDDTPAEPGQPPVEKQLTRDDPDWALHEPVTEIDKKDADTPDRWVPRHPDLIRLTGRHPFNCEPPPQVLQERGFITPASLHYIRNHGAVPNIVWGEHRVSVGGLVNKPMVFTMDDILKMPTVTVTATLTCAGNRRKEENMVKKTIGFNWGPAGTACGLWTGVRLSHVLQVCGIQTPEDGANHVCFRGPKGELPQGDDGSYATSLTYYKAMDPAGDVILAYKHNGRLLTPDHGYPIRIIIPGFIGGRMVKWLEEITVTETESNNFYHYMDNRVLPSHVDEQLAKKEGWWFKPDFIINDLNIQSAVFSPAHEEALPLTGNQDYVVKGYAYCGNGRKIIRCEISLDDGKSWRLADIRRFEKPNAYGRYYAWVFWDIAVPLVDLLRAKEIICRAWDDCMNTQPNTFTWNVMGMMNNCVYRVKIHAVPTANSGMALQFEHPTIAGPTVGGWMNRADKQVAVVEPPKPPPVVANGKTRQYTIEEVEKHDSKDSAWFVRNGKVYDATPFLKEHPGGAESILIVAGQDASDEFDAIHSDKAKAQLTDYCIGDLVDSKTAALANGNGHAPAAVEAQAPVALDPKKRIKLALVKKDSISHNTRRYRFALPTPQHRFGLPVGKHVFLYARVGEELVLRAYTPTSSDDDLGYFDLVVKVYWKGEHPRFPDGGKMSQHLESMQIGDLIEVKGPLGHFHYTGRGTYTLDGAAKAVKHISMIAGGTGITPMYQVIKAILKDPQDATCVSLLFANQTPDDILLQDELAAMAADPRVKIWYTVDRVPEGVQWGFSTGFVSEEMVREHLFPAGPETICVMCGPPPMIKFACLPNLEKLGYAPEQCISF